MCKHSKIFINMINVFTSSKKSKTQNSDQIVHKKCMLKILLKKNRCTAGRKTWCGIPLIQNKKILKSKNLTYIKLYFFTQTIVVRCDNTVSQILILLCRPLIVCDNLIYNALHPRWSQYCAEPVGPVARCCWYWPPLQFLPSPDNPVLYVTTLWTVANSVWQSSEMST